MESAMVILEGIEVDSEAVGVEPVSVQFIRVQLVPDRDGPSVVLDWESAHKLIDDLQSALDSCMMGVG